MGSRHCFLRIADTAYRMKTVLRFPEGMLTRCQDSVTVCGITNLSFVGLHTLQKVRIQFPFAHRKGDDMPEKSMKHIHTGTRARVHILMQRYALNVTVT